MVNHILTDISAHAKMGGSRGFKGVDLPEDLKRTSTKHNIKKQIKAEKIKTTMFSSLFFLSDFLTFTSTIYLQSFRTRVNITHNN